MWKPRPPASGACWTNTSAASEEGASEEEDYIKLWGSKLLHGEYWGSGASFLEGT